MYCRFCGIELPDDSLFCSSCGKQQAMDDPAPGSEHPPKRGLNKTILISLVGIFLVVAIVVALFCSGALRSGQGKGTDVGETEIPIVGDWRLDLSSPDIFADAYAKFVSETNDRNMMIVIFDELGQDFFVEQLSLQAEGIMLRFEADNTVIPLVDPEIYRNAQITANEKLYDAYAKMGLDSVSRITGESVASLQNRLDETGKTWLELLEEQRETSRLTISRTMTDEALVRKFKGQLNEDGLIERPAERFQYHLENNQLTLIKPDAEETVTLTVSYINGVMTVKHISSDNDVDAYFEGMKFIKIGS